MDSSFFLFFGLLVVNMQFVVGGKQEEVLPAQVYWQTVLPDTNMPSAIKDLLQPNGLVDNKAGTSVNVKPGGRGTHVSVGAPNDNSFKYLYAATDTQIHDNPNAALFFLKKDLYAGKKMTVRFSDTIGATSTSPTFLPRKTAESIPFSSEKFQNVLTRFDVGANTEDAKVMSKTIKECEAPAAQAEKRSCVTSLESMVDFATTALGTHKVQAVSTTLDKNPTSSKQDYIITTSGITKLGKLNSNAVACHHMPYVYAVFYCHTTAKTEAYTVKMVGKDGTKATVTAVCHTDTSTWNPKHLAFQVLKVKPGTVPVCHFLPQDHVVWSTK